MDGGERAVDDGDFVEPKGNQSTVIDATGGAHTVEAVAGSGKTTTMVLRLRKEILSRDTPPNRLLVLTFANEAAHAIREKLREVLPPEDAFDVDVYTYHSFSARLLQEYAYHVGLSPEFELVTDDDRYQLIETVYDEIDASFVAPGSPSAGGVSEATLAALSSFIESMRREAISPKAVREYLPSDEDLRELLSLVDALGEMGHDVVNADANDFLWDERELADRCDRLATVYGAKSAQFGGGEDDGVRAVVGDHLDAMRATAESVADHLRTADELETKDYFVPQALFGDERSSFSTVEQTPMGRLENFADMLRRARAFVGAYEAYMQMLDERNALDYQELIHRTVSLLRDESVRDDVLSQWDVVYCDEFQDTDESQLRLVEELRDDLDIMVVGDSDQAIHEWRGQDPENMSKLPDEFESIELERNFRSRQPILDLATTLDPDKSRIEADREPEPPNVFAIDSEGERTPAQVSTTISHLLTGRFEDIPARDLADVAVLVRRNENAREIAAQLDRESIPYNLSSGASGDLGEGIRTVLSYLRILVSPADDVSWQRVLLHCYRVPEVDIDTLLSAGATVPEGYDAVDESELVAPERVADALADYDSLTRVSATHSISELYHHLKRETRIDWFLREDDREALANIDRLISSFDDSPVESRLTPAFVAYLERQADLLATNDGVATETGSQSTGAVDVMTIHQAKGLDFDTVLLPFLTEDEFAHLTRNEYQQNLYRYDVLVDDIQGDLDDPLRADCRDDQIAEEWRVLHVALTRATDRLFLFGHSATDDGSDASLLDAHLTGPERETPTEWQSAGPRMRVWDALMDSYDAVEAEDPEAVRDYTTTVNRGVDEDPGTITYYETEVTTEDALETVLGFADEVVAGTLADDDERSRAIDAPLGRQLEFELARQHSHTSLETVRQCERKHFLDHVVGAFPDPETETASRDRLSTLVGTLFHEVADVAYWREYDEKAAWKEACRWLARHGDRSQALEPALACIDRYFETAVSEWPALGAEVPIDTTSMPAVDGDVAGYIDTVRRHPDGGLVVLDYKTGRGRKTRQESQQLELYVQASRDHFDDPVTHAGYVYVGDASPETQLFPAADLAEMQAELLADFHRADRSAFKNETAGTHCAYCDHRSLGCADGVSGTEIPNRTQ
ncbi:ATP-dependent helicase [Natrialbaceae archaeon A-arb3/5]